MEVPEPEPEPMPQGPAVRERDPGPPPNVGCRDIGDVPERRQGGGLTVLLPASPPERDFKGRLRSHIDGALSAKSSRNWIGVAVPAWVPLVDGTLELFLLDPIEGGYFALYRDPYDASSCGLSANKNCAYQIARFDCTGRQEYRLSLTKFFSRPDHLEVQDARLAGNVVYFNEACQTYSREAKGKCSSLVALDPVKKKVLWRSKALTSNNRFLVYDKYIVSGYGFTAEDDFLFVIRRTDGKVVQKVSIPSAHEDLLDSPNSVTAELSGGRGLMYKREGFDGDTPTLTLLTALVRAP